VSPLAAVCIAGFGGSVPGDVDGRHVRLSCPVITTRQFWPLEADAGRFIAVCPRLVGLPVAAHVLLPQSINRVTRTSGTFWENLEEHMGNPFVHVELNTSDVDKAKKFYGQLFA
jgi:hypothetical protein